MMCRRSIQQLPPRHTRLQRGATVSHVRQALPHLTASGARDKLPAETCLVPLPGAPTHMSLKIRRVVTGHDASGKAVVSIDEISKNVISRRPNHESCVIWTSGEFPADNGGDADDGLRKVGTVDPAGTVFRLVEYGPGVTPRNHRTESVDYAVVLKGEIDMEM